MGGRPILESAKDNVVIVKLVESPLSGKLAFYVAVANLSTESFDLSLDNIGASSRGQRVKIWSKSDIINKINRDAAWAAAAIAFSSAVDTYNASQPSTAYTTGQYHMYGPDIHAYGYSYGYVKTYNPAEVALAKEAIQRRTSDQLQQVASYTANVQMSVQDVITRDTINPGEYRGGLLIIDKPSGLNRQQAGLTLTIVTPTDVHNFDFFLYNR